ncbi:MAG: DUF2946 domain-containing protein [Candidatus Methylopumilus sp.]|nr:DUF2946 domain-containing protein [Candidatus Methylopumilus sp.]
MKNHLTRSFWVWLTAISVLLSALMPTLSHSARLQSADGSLAPICTSGGMKWLDTASGEIREQTTTNETAASPEHCTWCSVNPVALTSQPKVVPPLLIAMAEAALPVSSTHSHPFAWPPSHPRAPPTAA